MLAAVASPTAFLRFCREHCRRGVVVPAATALVVAGTAIVPTKGGARDGALAWPRAAAAARANPIVIENRRPGTTAWQLRKPANDTGGQIKGYASAVSVNKGGKVTFYVTVRPRQAFTIDVYRIGWYRGRGGRLLRHVGPLRGSPQNACPTDPTTGLIACTWKPAYSLATQRSWTSGIYLAKLTNSQGYQNYIMFDVRDDRSAAPLLYQQPVNTYQAYNNYPNDERSGKSLYAFNSYGATTITGGPNAAKVSFDRPYSDSGAGQFLDRDINFDHDINFVRWIERSGFDVTYSTNIDTQRDAASLMRHRGFLSVGHDEYWSKQMYDAAEAARNAGVNLAFFGANDIYWQVRFEPSRAGIPNRVMVCYRNPDIDPVADPSLKTVNWRQQPANRPEQRLIGIQYTAQLSKSQEHVPYIVLNSSNWVYSGTGFKDGDRVPGLVGYEADRSFSDEPLPEAAPGTYTLLSRSPLTTLAGSPDYANSSVYQATSGAWVFAAGTIDWSWGLDGFGSHGAQDSRIQRTTANILRRFMRHG